MELFKALGLLEVSDDFPLLAGIVHDRDVLGD